MTREISVKELIEAELSKDDIPLPIPKHIAFSLNRLLSNEYVAIKSLSDIIEKDPSLTAKVLNLSNSPVYAGLVMIKTIDQALTRLGLKTVRNFIMTILIKDVFKGTSKYLNTLFETTWRHSLGCALCSKRIAEHASMSYLAEDAYLAGLLHDIGTISILNTIVDLRNRDESQSFEIHHHLIIEIIYSFHSSIGARILQKLSFDDKLCAVVEAHENPDEYEDPDDPLLNILHTADMMMKKIGLSLKPDPNLTITGLPSTARLGLDPLFVSVTELDIEEIMEHTDTLL